MEHGISQPSLNSEPSAEVNALILLKAVVMETIELLLSGDGIYLLLR